MDKDNFKLFNTFQEHVCCDVGGGGDGHPGGEGIHVG